VVSEEPFGHCTAVVPPRPSNCRIWLFGAMNAVYALSTRWTLAGSLT
jgi:hypothetical protein